MQPDQARANPWTTHSNDVVYDNPWIEVTHREVTTPTGTDGIYGVVHFKNLAIGIIAIDDEDHTWLVGQYRYPIDRYSFEIPEGGGPLGVDPVESAKRELREECGLIADDVELLIEFCLSNSVTDEVGQIYLATGLTETDTDHDDTEEIEVHRVPVDEAIDMVLRGEIFDSLSIMGLLRLAERRRRTAT